MSAVDIGDWGTCNLQMKIQKLRYIMPFTRLGVEFTRLCCFRRPPQTSPFCQFLDGPLTILKCADKSSYIDIQFGRLSTMKCANQFFGQMPKVTVTLNPDARRIDLPHRNGVTFRVDRN